MRKFIDGRYGRKSSEGAMCGLLRQSGHDDPSKLTAQIAAMAEELNCHPEIKPVCVIPSKRAPDVNNFDTVHIRAAPATSPILLVHFFSY